MYEGKLSDGKFHLATDGGLACLHFAPHTEVDEADCFGALLSVAADGGSAGTELKAAYDAAPDKRAFARIIGRALQLENEREEATSAADIAWLQALPLQQKRAAVYASLRARRIVVYNPLYNPGKAFGTGGCNYAATRDASAYPTYDEPIPPSGCDAAFSAMRRRQLSMGASRSPSASADFGFGFDLACGYEKAVELDFDDEDRLTGIVVSPEHHTCL